MQVLQEFISESGIIPDPLLKETLREACLAKKSMLLYQIWPLADVAYSEEPEIIISRLSSYWKVFANA
jgi:hypothetical protein